MDRVPAGFTIAKVASIPRKIISDTDPGQDDAVALLLALASPEELEVLGIVAVAVVITIVFFVMLLTPKDFAALDRALAPAAPKEKTQEDRGTPGVTTMQLYDAKKK